MIVAACASVPRVQLPDRLGAEPVDPLLLQPRRARRAEMPHDLQRRHVVAVAHRRREASRCAPSSSARRRATRGGTGRSSCSVRSASNLPPSTTWLPASSAGDRPHERTVVVQRPGHHHACRRASSSSSGLASGSIERGRGVEDQLRPAGAAARRHALPRIRDRVEPRRTRPAARGRASNRAAGMRTPG